MEENTNKNSHMTNKDKRLKVMQRFVKAIAVIVIALIIFKIGVFVGYRKAGFSYRFGENYYRTFGGQRLDSGRGMMNGFMHDNMPGGHGVTGKVIKVSLPTIIVEGSDNIEKVININNDTLIRNMMDTATPTDIKIDDSIIVIGSPTPTGEIDAKLIRIISPIQK